MFEDPKVRISIIIVLVAILIGFFVWHGTIQPDPEKGNYPGSEELIEEYDKHVGEKVEVGGKVVKTDPLTIETEHGDKSIELKITGTNVSVKEGDRLSVYGTLKEDGTIKAEEVVKTPYLNYVYMYLVSLVGAIWISIRLVKQWRWNSEELWFDKREETLELKQVLTGGGEDG